MQMFGVIHINDPAFLRQSRYYVEICLFFRGVFQKRDLSKKDKTMMFETHCMSCPYTELLLFKYANINSISHYRAPLSKKKKKNNKNKGPLFRILYFKDNFVK